MAGRIATMIGAVAGAPAGGWVSWLAAILCGVMATALSRRLSTLIGAAFMIAFVASVIVDSTLWAVCLTVLGAAVLLFGAMAAGSAWTWAVGKHAGRETAASDGTATGPAPHTDGRATPPRRPARPQTSRRADIGPAPEPLPASQVEHLARLAERDTASFRAALGQLSAGQRQQVRQALSARRQRTAGDAS